MEPFSVSQDEVQAPLSPYLGKKLTVKDHLAISGFWLATNAHWGALLVVMIPGEIAKIAPSNRAAALGLFTAVGAIFAIFCPLIVGPLSDRCASKLGRRRPYIAVGTGVNTVGLLIMAMVVTAFVSQAGSSGHTGGSLLGGYSVFYYLLLVGFLIVQFGNNVATAAYMGVLPDLVPDDQRGVASGYYAVMCQVGTLVGAVGAGLLLAKLPASAQYGFLILLFLIIGPLTLLGFKENALIIKPKPLQWVPYLKSLWISPKDQPDFFWVWITRFLVMLGFYGIEPFINYYLRDVIHLQNPASASGILIGVILVAASISGFLGGSLSDKIGRKKVVYFATGVMAVFVLGFSFCHNFLQTLGIGTIFGLGFGAYTSVDWALGTDVLPDLDHAAKHMAVWHVSMTLPQSIAPPIAGAIIGAFVLEASPAHAVTYSRTGYDLVFIFCAICFILGAVFLKNIRSVT